MGEAHDYRKDLGCWFELSYAKFATLPRVLMEAMPPEWQEKMAELLFQYDEAFPNMPDIGTTVRATKNGKLVPMPEVFMNYRHPDRAAIDAMRKEPHND